MGLLGHCKCVELFKKWAKCFPDWLYYFAFQPAMYEDALHPCWSLGYCQSFLDLTDLIVVWNPMVFHGDRVFFFFFFFKGRLYILKQVLNFGKEIQKSWKKSIVNTLNLDWPVSTSCHIYFLCVYTYSFNLVNHEKVSCSHHDISPLKTFTLLLSKKRVFSCITTIVCVITSRKFNQIP